MDCSPNLRRQRSCGSPAMGLGNWWNSRHRSTGFGRRFAESVYEDEYDQPYYSMAVEPTRRSWLGFWKRIMRKKKKIFESKATPIRDRAPYDPFTYAQNFDRGSARLEPENLSRSFSAQFANPSGILRRIG